MCCRPLDVDKLIRETPGDDATQVIWEHVVPWVQAELLQRIQAGEFESVLPGAQKVSALSEVKPLGITGASDALLKSYKAPINAADAANALATTGMYEAGDSLFAVSARPPTGAEDKAIAGIGDCTPWSLVADAGARLEQVEVAAGQGRRVILGTTLACAVREGEAVGPGKTLVTGHVVVWGWYVAMARALAAPQGTDKEAASWKDRVHELLQCALTVTVHVRLGLTAAQRATWSIQLSEQRKCEHKLADTFPQFAAKAWVALGPGDHRNMSQQKLLDTLKALQINFNNLTLNKVMVGYVVDFADDCNNGLRGAPKSSSGLSATAASTSSAPATRSSVR